MTKPQKKKILNFLEENRGFLEKGFSPFPLFDIQGETVDLFVEIRKNNLIEAVSCLVTFKKEEDWLKQKQEILIELKEIGAEWRKK